MQAVSTAARDGVDHAARSAAVLGGGVRGDHLEFLDRILRKLGCDAGAAGVLVVKLLGGIVAVHKKGIAAGDAAEAEQAEGSIVADAGSKQHK